MIESSDVFKAIETAIPQEVIDVTIGTTQAKEERKHKLPSSHLESLSLIYFKLSSLSSFKVSWII